MLCGAWSGLLVCCKNNGESTGILVSFFPSYTSADRVSFL